jgi:hypothetical protein
MDKLYPIIRRKRRPLVEQKAETLKPETLKSEAPVQPVVKAPEVEPAIISKPDDAENFTSPEAP